MVSNLMYIQCPQGSTDGGLFQQIPIFFNNRYRYRPPILEAEIIGHRPSVFLSNFRPSVYIKFKNSSKIQPTNCYTLCITYLYESVNNGVWEFFCTHFGTVTQCSVEPTVPKCAHKIPKFIKNSAKFHQTPLITDSFKNIMHKVQQLVQTRISGLK